MNKVIAKNNGYTLEVIQCKNKSKAYSDYYGKIYGIIREEKTRKVVFVVSDGNGDDEWRTTYAEFKYGENVGMHYISLYDMEYKYAVGDELEKIFNFSFKEKFGFEMKSSFSKAMYDKAYKEGKSTSQGSDFWKEYNDMWFKVCSFLMKRMFEENKITRTLFGIVIDYKNSLD